MSEKIENTSKKRNKLLPLAATVALGAAGIGIGISKANQEINQAPQSSRSIPVIDIDKITYGNTRDIILEPANSDNLSKSAVKQHDTIHLPNTVILDSEQRTLVVQDVEASQQFPVGENR